LPWESERFQTVADFLKWHRGQLRASNQTRILLAWAISFGKEVMRNAVREGIASAFNSDFIVPEPIDPAELVKHIPGYVNLKSEEDKESGSG
jgi:hypothetical protein